MTTLKIKRNAAADLIERIRSIAATQDNDAIHEALAAFGIPEFEACTGEAHSNPHIDNCGVCAPRWGLLGARVQVT